MLVNPFNQYEKNLQSARDLEIIYLALCAMTQNSIPKEELLRATYVSLLSTFDTYIHDIVRDVLKLYYTQQGLNTSNQYLKKILENNQNILSLEDLNQYIQEKHGYKTFQAPKKVEQILTDIGINNIWNSFTHELPDVELQLSLIVKRRNQIAHESDINPTNGLGEKWSIDMETITKVRTTLDFIIKKIDSVIKNLITP